MAKQARIFIANESFINAAGRVVTAGMLVSEDSDDYRAAPGYFSLAPGQVRPEVEAASAAPGEKRDVKV